MMDIFIEKHRILCLIRTAMAYMATNIDLGYLTQLLAFDSNKETEGFLSKLGCKMMSSPEKRLMCKDSLLTLKKATLKLKESAKAKIRN